jgi:hypothetical protein
MLGDDQAGHDLQRLADTRERHGVHLLAGEAYRAGGSGLQGRRWRVRPIDRD